MNIAAKMAGFPPSIFLRMAAAEEKARAQGLSIVNLGIGTPDLPPPPEAVAALTRAAAEPGNYRYSLTDLPEYIDAGLAHYRRNFGVTLARENLCGLIGSQDALAHLPLALLNPGDVALLPNPGYPMFRTGPLLASAEMHETRLDEETGYLPDLEAIPADVAHRAKLLYISYPANPLGKLAAPGFFERAVWFARKYDVAILHDNAYGDLVFDGRMPESFLAAKGASEVGVELYSLSKSFNMTGARASYAAGHPGILKALLDIKSSIDYGMFFPVQHAAVAALAQAEVFLDGQRRAYQRRRDALIAGLRENGWNVEPPEGSMFVWARLPGRFADSLSFVTDLLESAGVSLVPGISFGSLGEGFVRIALTRPEDVLRDCAQRIGVFLRAHT